MGRVRQRRRSRLSYLLEAAFLLLLLYSCRVVTWWQEQPNDLQAVIVILVVFTALCGGGSLIALAAHRRRQRHVVWRRAMVAWRDARRAAKPDTSRLPTANQDYIAHQALSEFERGRSDRTTAYHFRSVSELTPAGLEDFAALVYERMGFTATVVGGSRDHGVDVRLVNPNRQIEIVQCKQLQGRVGEPVVRNLLGAMQHEKAIRAHLWAPRGFTRDAQEWASGKPIILADEREIERLVDVAYRAEVEGQARGE